MVPSRRVSTADLAPTGGHPLMRAFQLRQFHTLAKAGCLEETASYDLLRTSTVVVRCRCCTRTWTRWLGGRPTERRRLTVHHRSEAATHFLLAHKDRIPDGVRLDPSTH